VLLSGSSLLNKPGDYFVVFARAHYAGVGALAEQAAQQAAAAQEEARRARLQADSNRPPSNDLTFADLLQDLGGI